MPTKLLSIASPQASGIPYTDTNSNLGDADDVQDAIDNAGVILANTGAVFDINGQSYKSVWIGTQAEYDLLTPEADVLYLIKEAEA